MSTYNGVPCSPEVAEFLAASDQEMRRNEMNRGLAYRPDPDAFVRDVVRDYVETFAWNGVSAGEVVAETGRDERWVKRALKELVADGTLRVEESLTRGYKASKRKRYFYTADNRAPIESYGDDPDRIAPADPEFGAGGGRKVTAPLPD